MDLKHKKLTNKLNLKTRRLYKTQRKWLWPVFLYASLFLVIALSAAVLVYKRDVVKPKLNHYYTLLKAVANNPQMLLPSSVVNLWYRIVLRNMEEDNIRSIVSLFVIEKQSRAVHKLQELSYLELMETEYSNHLYRFIGSGAFIRTKFLSTKSNVILSAAHVCIIGLAKKNLHDYKKQKLKIETVINEEEEPGVFMLAKATHNKLYRIKKVYVDVQKDLCLLETDKESSFSIPVKRGYQYPEVGEQITLYASAANNGFVASPGKVYNVYKVKFPFYILCNLEAANKLAKDLITCADNMQCALTLETLFGKSILEIVDNTRHCLSYGTMPKMFDVRLIRILGTIYSGYSGGVAVNDQGLIVGVISMTHTYYNNLGYLVPINTLYKQWQFNEWDYVVSEQDELKWE